MKLSKLTTRRCECEDPGCSAHPAVSGCDKPAAHVLFRIDMEDETGTAFCEACAADAWESGVFGDKPTSEQRE